MSLQEQLDRVRAEELERTPEPVRAVFREAQQYLHATGVGGDALKVGDTAPDFTLPDTGGSSVSLRAMRERGPVILDFFRGGWCPFCSLELRAYQQVVESIEDAGASLLAVAPETPHYLREAVELDQLSFPVLSDSGNEIARSYGIVYALPEALREIYSGFGLDLPERQGSSSFELPIPATYLVDRGGTIRRAFLDLDVSKRAEPEDFIAGVRALEG